MTKISSHHDAIRKQYSKSSVPRITALIDCLHKADEAGLPGDFAECGVWRGGSVIVARLASPSRTCWLYDTFAGMTRPEDIDRTVAGGRKAIDSWNYKRDALGTNWQTATLEEVVENFRATDTYDESKLRFVKGPVEKTLLIGDNLPDRIAVLRLDTDWYASTKIEMEVLYPRLVSGGSLIVDDYGHWAGCRKAVDEYFGRDGMPNQHKIDYTAIVVVKP